jgi:curved DNA-binding protein CbpA
MLNENQTLYDLLDIDSDASPQEIRDAYLRTKTTYNRDNLVLYTLVSPDEREDALKKIEEAYLVLSDPDKRRAYDQNHRLFQSYDNPFAGSDQKGEAKVISIDRVPPMENVLDGENLLIPPKTDFQNRPKEDFPAQNSVQASGQQGAESKDSFQAGSDLPFIAATEVLTQSDWNSKSDHPQIVTSPAEKVEHSRTESKQPLPKLDPALVHEVEIEEVFSGAFIRKIREAYQISLEEMSGITKVTKTYLNAIEEENFQKLPAPVYVRGFVVQISKVLRLPHEKLAVAYLGRYYAKKPDLER